MYIVHCVSYTCACACACIQRIVECKKGNDTIYMCIYMYIRDCGVYNVHNVYMDECVEGMRVGGRELMSSFLSSISSIKCTSSSTQSRSVCSASTQCM